jgi:hypothetical protein
MTRQGARKWWCIPVALPLLTVLLALTSCVPFGSRKTVEIEWVNFVQFHGVMYTTPTVRVGRAPTGADLGPIFATVRFNVADNVDDPNYQLRDGDAAFLAAGTPVYSVKGYATSFRLAAQFAGELTFYEADTNPHATTGGDLLAIGGKVSSIGLNDDTGRGTTELAAISDSSQVAHLVSLILAAPFSQHPPQASGTRYFLALHLLDGTAVTRAYWPDIGELAPGILLPPEFQSAVHRALGQ